MVKNASIFHFFHMCLGSAHMLYMNLLTHSIPHLYRWENVEYEKVGNFGGLVKYVDVLKYGSVS